MARVKKAFHVRGRGEAIEVSVDGAKRIFSQGMKVPEGATFKPDAEQAKVYAEFLATDEKKK
jgi:hypothetical protein